MKKRTKSACADATIYLDFNIIQYLSEKCNNYTANIKNFYDLTQKIFYVGDNKFIANGDFARKSTYRAVFT